jgi:hypothetical protein
MTKPGIARTPIPDIATLPEDNRARILTVQEKSGFISNVFLMQAHRPSFCPCMWWVSAQRPRICAPSLPRIMTGA